MNFIVAVDENWGIGKNGGLLTHIPDDLKYFKAKTMDGIIVLGRKTLESFPGGKPLPGRINIVFTRNRDYKQEDVITVSSVDELMDVLKNYPDKEVFAAGGAEIYALLMPYCDKAYITHIYSTFDADTYLKFDTERWEKVSEEPMEYKGLRYGFAVYNRI